MMAGEKIASEREINGSEDKFEEDASFFLNHYPKRRTEKRQFIPYLVDFNQNSDYLTEKSLHLSLQKIIDSLFTVNVIVDQLIMF